MKNKQTKKISLFTEEEIKILLELGFESNGEEGKETQPCNIKSFWKSYYDPKDDEEWWQQQIKLTEKPGVFEVNYFSWRYPHASKRIKGIDNVLLYLESNGYIAKIMKQVYGTMTH
jgi:hypothetical protein